MSSEILAIVPLLKKPKSFGRWDSYTLVVTEKQAIFAQLTSKMLKEAAAEAQSQGKEQGKGFFARWGDQLKSGFTYHERYWSMAPESIIAENPGNFTMDNSSIGSIRVKRKLEHRQDDIDETKTELEFQSSAGKFRFSIDGYSDETAKVLRQVYGDRVKT